MVFSTLITMSFAFFSLSRVVFAIHLRNLIREKDRKPESSEHYHSVASVAEHSISNLMKYCGSVWSQVNIIQWYTFDYFFHVITSFFPWQKWKFLFLHRLGSAYVSPSVLYQRNSKFRVKNMHSSYISLIHWFTVISNWRFDLNNKLIFNLNSKIPHTVFFHEKCPAKSYSW